MIPEIISQWESRKYKLREWLEDLLQADDMIRLDCETLEAARRSEIEQRDKAEKRGNVALVNYHDGRAMALEEILSGEYDF